MELLYSGAGEYMSARLQTATVNATGRVIQNLAEQNHVTYHATDNDRLAHHMTRLAGDVVELDPIEQLLVGLQRVGRIDRALMVRLQARYLRETKP
jgi:DNA topoisomerase IA